MLDSKENAGSDGEYRTPKSQNLVTANHVNNYISKNNNNEENALNEITSLGINTTSGNGGFGYPNEWASSFEDDTDGGVGGSIAERRAATRGFNAGSFSVPTINVARFRSVSSFSSPASRSPYITIPAGISPTELLDSPVMLHNSQVSDNEWVSSFEDDRDGGVGGSIAEKKAATHGFNAESFSVPTINEARFRSVSSLFLLASQSPYITIPAGISPTELLNSLVMLHNSQAQSSPTTGTFQPSPLHRESIMLDSATPATDRERESNVGSSSRSQLLENHISFQSASSMGSKAFELPDEFSRSIVRNSDSELSTDFENSSLRINRLASQSCFEGDQQGSSSASGPSKTSEDGYNWRKYGQKQVKGSEFPRSYYKCTYPNCLVKKKIEQFHDGEVAEIIYTGIHNHPLPQPNTQSNVGKYFSDNNGGMNESHGEDEAGGIVWRNIQPRVDPQNDQCENLDPFPITQLISSGVYETPGPSKPSCVLVCPDKDGTPLDGTSIDDCGYLNESNSKRRKVKLSFPEERVASRGGREPRVVVQIESEIDILEDGYRWRKYGQKVVKGNPNPRSYYKCTSVGCPVRKQVERACDDYKSVITSYEGKHNHELPVARTTAVSGNNLSPATSSPQPAYALPRINTKALKSEPQLQSIPELGNDFSAVHGNLGSDMYPLHFSGFQNPLSYHYGGMPNFQMPFSYGVPRSSMMMPDGVGLYNLGSPIQSSVGEQQLRENDLGLIKPIQENTKE